MNNLINRIHATHLQKCQQLATFAFAKTGLTSGSGIRRFSNTMAKTLKSNIIDTIHTRQPISLSCLSSSAGVVSRVGKTTFSIIPKRTMTQNTTSRGSKKDRNSVVLYIGAAGIFMLGLGYAGVPLYRMFCQATGYGGTVMTTVGHDTSKIESMKPVKERKITVNFNADTASSMQWQFRPQQPKVELVPGETALAFYTAKNPTDKPVIGISTYNVIPFEAGLYFNKIQCFCFEEQRLNPHEQVDMPVFFFIDPEYDEDPKLELVDEITLSYTFFEAKEGMKLPLPGYMQPTKQPQ